MSVCGQTEEDSASEEMGAPIREIYQQKAVSKVVRVLTVLAYLLSVSLAAILLSVYYIYVWKSPILPLVNDTKELSARRGSPEDYDSVSNSVPVIGGSNPTVSVTQPITADVSEEFPNVNETLYPDAATGTTRDEEAALDLGTLPSLPELYNGTADDSELGNATGTVT